MLDVADDLVRPVARLGLAVLRALWWLSWELWLESVSWTIGWFTCRAVSLGRVPSVALGDRESAGTGEALVVHLSGMASLFGAMTLFAQLAYG